MSDTVEGLGRVHAFAVLREARWARVALVAAVLLASTSCGSDDDDPNRAVLWQEACTVTGMAYCQRAVECGLSTSADLCETSFVQACCQTQDACGQVSDYTGSQLEACYADMIDAECSLLSQGMSPDSC